MPELSHPPIWTKFINDDGFLTESWISWFEDISNKLGIPLSELFILENSIISNTDEINITTTSNITINDKVLNYPSASDQYLKYDGSALSWGTTSFPEDVQVGALRPVISDSVTDGWVEMDRGTIGNLFSSATNRANADTQDLFVLLWDNTSNSDCAVSGGKGSTALDDFNAHKTIELPNSPGRTINVISTSGTLCGTGGGETNTMIESDIPLHPHTITNAALFNGIAVGSPTTWFVHEPRLVSGTPTYTISASSLNPATSLTGSGNAQNVMQPTTFLKWEMKL